jgi:hypothetical protein
MPFGQSLSWAGAVPGAYRQPGRTLEQAKADFQATWAAFKAANESTEDSTRQPRIRGARPEETACAFGHAMKYGEPDIYDNAPWTEMAIEDLKNHVAHGATLEETASFLCPLNVAKKGGRSRPSLRTVKLDYRGIGRGSSPGSGFGSGLFLGVWPVVSGADGRGAGVGTIAESRSD